ncbi:hypothetical protein Pcinc_041569 [Petrolisthes cinctipes]|uniref:Uncharacterized protein n=1 Tax=Petrolisthes cinctipes TaxID=88211 RepID=A0AAE1BJL4_PETCI|nr:hypothetical protein Pcinc_041569 [Petrolisthes cinctipes]
MSNSFRSYTSSVPSDPQGREHPRRLVTASCLPTNEARAVRPTKVVWWTAVFLCGSLHSLYCHWWQGKQCIGATRQPARLTRCPGSRWSVAVAG